jgi:thiamine biosynthesis lipoprotein
MASQYNFEAIGTHWQIDIYESITTEQEAVLFAAIEERIAMFDKTYSRFRTDSLVTVMSQQTGTFTLPDDAEPMLKLYHDLYDITDGFFSPFMGQVLSDAGYDKDYSLQQSKELSAPPSWYDAIFYHHPELEIKRPVLFDFGAAGKGYAIDLVAEVIETFSIKHYCVDAGGDILHRNDTPLIVGMENPKDATEVIGTIPLQNKSICGSAGNRRKWANFNHIINPKTLSSPENILAIWVVADTTMLADGLATCLFFVPAATLQKKYQFEYIILRDDFSIEMSEQYDYIQ